MNVSDVIAIEEVQADLDRGEDFYESQAFGIGSYFRACMIADIESLILYAGIHSKRLGYYRMFARKLPFAIYYEVQGSIAIVVAVLDMRRKPSFINQNLRSRQH